MRRNAIKLIQLFKIYDVVCINSEKKVRKEFSLKLEEVIK